MTWLRVLLYLLPKKGLTHLVGKVSRSRWSRLLIPYYVQMYRIDPHEAEHPLSHYSTLMDFFSRRLKPELRPLTSDPQIVSAPVDGRVIARGSILPGQVLRIKGCKYTLEQLMQEKASQYVGGEFLTLYLSPRDYHRIHAPLPATVHKLVRVTGAYFPVNELGRASIPQLYARNERVIIQLQNAKGKFVLVAVGAMMVGSVQINEQERYAAGEEVGWFELGSTVILVFPPGMVDLAVQDGDTIKACEPIGYIK